MPSSRLKTTNSAITTVLIFAAFSGLWTDISEGRIYQGASTITQQLARNAFLSHERTWSRKLRELLWTIQIERKYSKDEILESYLNVIWFGHGAYGVEAASQTYFGKSVDQLTLPEAALLAGIPLGPWAVLSFHLPRGGSHAAQRSPQPHAGSWLHQQLRKRKRPAGSPWG